MSTGWLDLPREIREYIYFKAHRLLWRDVMQRLLLSRLVWGENHVPVKWTIRMMEPASRSIRDFQRRAFYKGYQRGMRHRLGALGYINIPHRRHSPDLLKVKNAYMDHVRIWQCSTCGVWQKTLTEPRAPRWDWHGAKMCLECRPIYE